MRNVLDNSILVVESVVHLLLHILVLLFEFPDGVSFYLLDPLLLRFKLFLKLVSELCLSLLSTLLLSRDSVLHYIGLIS